jgi:hypothetical protein
MLLCVAAALLVYAAVSNPVVPPRRAPASPPSAAAAPPSVEVAQFAAPPLTTLTESVERPLFSAGRRPLAPDQPAAAAATPIKKGEFVLVGVSIRTDRRDALLRRNSTGTLAWVGEGDKLEGWTVKTVQPDRVTLEQGSEREELDLWTAENKPPAPPPARAAAPRTGTAPPNAVPRPLQAAPPAGAPAGRQVRPVRKPPDR